MAASYGVQCISILIISYVLHIMMHFDNCKSHDGAVRPNFLFLMMSHHFLQICGNWSTRYGIHYKLVKFDACGPVQCFDLVLQFLCFNRNNLCKCS